MTSLTGNPDEEESVKSPATISPPQRRGRRSSDDKENIPLRKERSDEKKAFSWVDSSRDDTRSLEDGGFLTPSGRGWSSLGDTSQDTSSPHCTTKNGKSSSRRRKSSDCAGLQASVGFRPCTSCEPLETYDSDDDTQFTQYSPERGDFCINRGRNQTMSPVERNDSVGVLTLLDDSRFMVDSVNASENDSTVSAPIHETSLQLHMNTPEFDDTCSDLTEMAFTFHSTDEDVVATGTGRQFSSFLGSPRKNSAVFSDAVARLPVTSDDTDSDVTRDSTDFCFTFHTESSQVHVGNDRHGEDFRFTDCDSGCSTMGTLPLSFHTY